MYDRIVVFRVHTHEAVQNEVASPTGSSVVPGLTLRDVRLAYLTENAYVHAMLNHEALPPKTGVQIGGHGTPMTARDVEWRRTPPAGKRDEASGSEVVAHPPRLSAK